MGRPHDMWSIKEAATTPTGYIVNTRTLGNITVSNIIYQTNLSEALKSPRRRTAARHQQVERSG